MKPSSHDLAGHISRRHFLRYAVYTAGAVTSSQLLTACGGGGNGSFNAGGDTSNTTGTSGTPGTPSANVTEIAIPTGPLGNIPTLEALPQVDGIRVPSGFSVKVVARSGSQPAAASSYSWHQNPDGGACYETVDGWIYACNSELVPGGGVGALAFSHDAGNDTTSVTDAYRILSNTRFNCAGGKTPWNTWLSCEEQGDGAVFECDPYTRTDADAVRKPNLGLFSHEAVAVDPRNQVIYLTEDGGDQSRFYRWIPTPGDWPSGGRAAMDSGTLQVMNIEGFENGGYSQDPAALRQLLRVSWENVFRNDIDQSTSRDESINAQGFAPGTRTPGGEGLWFFELPEPTNAQEAAAMTPSVSSRAIPVPTRGIVCFTTKADNRVYALDIENQVVELIFDNDQIDQDMSDVDNLTISPAGDILVAEDLVGARNNIRIIVVIPNQQAKVLVEVQQTGSEITGPAFSPDGSRLYFNSQRGPSIDGVGGLPAGAGTGATYELFIPPEFRG